MTPGQRPLNGNRWVALRLSALFRCPYWAPHGWQDDAWGLAKQLICLSWWWPLSWGGLMVRGSGPLRPGQWAGFSGHRITQWNGPESLRAPQKTEGLCWPCWSPIDAPPLQAKGNTGIMERENQRAFEWQRTSEEETETERGQWSFLTSHLPLQPVLHCAFIAWLVSFSKCSRPTPNQTRLIFPAAPFIAET